MSTKERLAWVKKMTDAHHKCNHSEMPICCVKTKWWKQVLHFINPMNPF